MREIFENAGIFAWPLAACSFLALFIVLERLFSLRKSQILPRRIEEAFLEGRIPPAGDGYSVSDNILRFWESRSPDAEQLKAYARLQVRGMERGLFLLDVVISAAPLLGLLGTVTGLVKVFGEINPETGMPDPGMFVEGVAMALNTTMIGLAIAIPALAFNGFLQRRIDTFSARIDVGLEKLISNREG